MTFDEWWDQRKSLKREKKRKYLQEIWLIAFTDGYNKGTSAFSDAIKFEREECAKIADESTKYTPFRTSDSYKIAALISASIRGRSK